MCLSVLKAVLLENNWPQISAMCVYASLRGGFFLLVAWVTWDTIRRESGYMGMHSKYCSVYTTKTYLGHVAFYSYE